MNVEWGAQDLDTEAERNTGPEVDDDAELRARCESRARARYKM